MENRNSRGQFIKGHNGISLKGRIPWNKGKKHIPEAILKMRKSHLNHPRSNYVSWNKGLTGLKYKTSGKRILNQYGYFVISSYDHPSRIGKTNKYMKEHRLIIEKYLGRLLTKSEIVHHIDGNKLNNKIENLRLMTQTEHVKLHKQIETNSA